MDIKTEIKEEDNLSNDVGSQNEREFFHKVLTIKRNSNAVLLDDDCDMTIKSETAFNEHLKKQIKSEIVTCSENWEIKRTTEIEQQTLISHCGSQNAGEFLPDDPVTKLKYNSGDEMHDKIEIKEEPWWLETGTSSVCLNIKNGDFPLLKSSRLYTKAVSGNSNVKSQLLSAKDCGRAIGFCNGKDCTECDSQESYVTEMSTIEEHIHSEQPGKSRDAREVQCRALYLKQKNLFYKTKKTHQCKTCDKSFKQLSALKKHNLIHEGKKPHQCKTCDKSFTLLGNLKMHNMIHEGKKPYQCKTCDRSFTLLGNLKLHRMVHEGKKPHQCKTCDKSFTLLGNLKVHNMIHEGKKPHLCKTCDKGFTTSSHLKRHNLIHESKKPHQCTTCNKSFTDLLSLNIHKLIHEGKKPYQCKTCDKSFSWLSSLKSHNLIHEDKKPHQCETCDKDFASLSHLKRHNLVHEGKKPHQCKTCHKSFTLLSHLKRHNLIHVYKNP